MVDRAVSVCFYPIPMVAEDFGEDMGGLGQGGDSRSPHMAEEVVVCPSASDRMRDSMSPVSQHGSPVTHIASQGHPLPFRPEDP